MLDKSYELCYYNNVERESTPKPPNRKKLKKS